MLKFFAIFTLYKKILPTKPNKLNYYIKLFYFWYAICNINY